MKSRYFSTRTRQRKRAIDVLFEADQRGLSDTSEALLGLLAKRRELSAAQTPLPPYAGDIVEGVAEHLSHIDELIATHFRGNYVQRLSAVERAILRAGVWEVVWNDDVEAIIAIDEAVRIARAIADDHSPGIVNGILDAIRREAAASRAADDAVAAALASVGQANDQCGGENDDSGSDPGGNLTIEDIEAMHTVDTDLSGDYGEPFPIAEEDD